MSIVNVTCYFQVVVNVVNEMPHSSLTLHFHGMHMKNNPWMDGVPYVSQCPVNPKVKN